MKHSNDPFWVLKYYSMMHFVILHSLDKIMTVFKDKSKPKSIPIKKQILLVLSNIFSFKKNEKSILESILPSLSSDTI